MATDWRPAASRSMIETRAGMLKSIRAFFDARDVIEVETPILSRYAVTDVHLESFAADFQGERFYLNTSPEYAMKRLLADTALPVYQITRAFRNDEYGQFHNPEFSMLEWYRPAYSLIELMDELEQLVTSLMTECGRTAVFQRLSYQQAFETYVGLNPHTVNSRQCQQRALELGIEIPVGLGQAVEERDDWLDWLLTQVLLPQLPSQQFTILYDYPASQAALARLENNASGYLVARRFELLYGELELANAFDELTDAEEQAARFECDREKRKLAGKTDVMTDTNLLAALQHGLTRCAGIAVGLDRLLMVLTAKTSIDEVLAFPWQRI